MRFFELKDKDSVLNSLNGNKLKYVFRVNGLTDAINQAKRKIEEALYRRNWQVPGIKVDFIYDYDMEGNHTLRVSTITADPKLCADVRVNSWSVRVRGMEMSLHEDNSGSLEVYCGDDWDKDRNEFVNGKRFHRKMDGKSRIVLQYNTHRGYKFEATDDCSRGHFPSGSELEPMSYSIPAVEKDMLVGLNDMLDYIESHPEQDVDKSLFAEPNPTYLTNELFAGSKFRTHVSNDVAYRLKENNKKSNHGMDGGWRLLDLSISPPKNHPYANLMNEGFTYCSIEWPNGKIDDHNWHYNWDKKTAGVNLKKVDNVFVVDQAQAEKFKEQWFQNNPGIDTMDNAGYQQMLIERAATMVHINDYKGGFEKPVVVICRVLSKDELVLSKEVVK